MTTQVTELRPTADDEANALAMLRKDAVAYVTSLFDWIEAAGTGSGIIFAFACFNATEKPFSEVLTEMIAAAAKEDDFYLFQCTEREGCTCLNCRYPAEPDEDPRPPWTQLLDNVRLTARRTGAES